MSDIIPDDSIMQPGYLPRTPFDAPHNPYCSVLRFREDRPVFADETDFPNQSVQFFLDIAGIMVNPRYWGTFTVFGQQLVAAHFLALQRYAMLQMERGAAGGGGGALGGVVPGMPIGMMQSKSVSKVSVSYDYSHSMIEGGGPWNLTTFGQQYLWLAQLVGTGGIEMLSIGYAGSLTGRVNSWAHGVMTGYYYGGI